MSEPKSTPANSPLSIKRSFAAMRHPGFRAQFITFVLAMIKAGMALFITVSLSRSYFFVTDTLQMWQAPEPHAALRYRGAVGSGERGAARRDGALPRCPVADRDPVKLFHGRAAVKPFWRLA